MYAQLMNRKKGVTFGSFKVCIVSSFLSYICCLELYELSFSVLGEFFIIQVSKDIKYADKQPIIPWGPR